MKQLTCNTGDSFTDELIKNYPLNKNNYYQIDLLVNIMKENIRECENYCRVISELKDYDLSDSAYKIQKFYTLNNILLENNKWINYNIELFRFEVLKIREELSSINYCYCYNVTYENDITINIGEGAYLNLFKNLLNNIYDTINFDIIENLKKRNSNEEQNKIEKYKLPEELYTNNRNVNKVLYNIECLLEDVTFNLYHIVERATNNFNVLFKCIKDNQKEANEVLSEYYEIIFDMKCSYYREIKSILRDTLIYLYEEFGVFE